MQIELADSVLNFRFQHCQVEITGKCNMRCEHCRAWEEVRVHMDFPLFKKTIDFAVSESFDNFRVTISGGEPFLHPELIRFLRYLKEKGVENVIITSNASLITREKLQQIKDIDFGNIVIQISIDSDIPEDHDKFRNFNGAFEKAMKAFDMLKELGMQSSLRTSLTPDKIDRIERLIGLAKSKGAMRVGIGSIIPSGRAKGNRSLWMNARDKKRFLETLVKFKKSYPEMDITTEDPQKFALENCPWTYGDFNINESEFYDGCSAGISGFNVDSTGVITPCAVLLKNIVDLKSSSIEEAKKMYVRSDVIRNLFERKFKGKCGKCRLVKLCGGCRAVAEGVSGDYLGSDATCFYNGK